MKKKYSKNNTEKILQVLNSNPDLQFSVSDIYTSLHEKGAKLNLTTVYRQLEKLVKSGKVLQFASPDGSGNLFKINDLDCKNHLHIQCVICKRTSHLDCNIANDFLQHIKKEHHIKANCKNSILFGTCDACKKSDTSVSVQKS